MKKKTSPSKAWQMLAATPVILFMFGCNGSGGLFSHSAEDLRLKHACHIDTVSIGAVISPDSIGGHEQIDALSAEAWIMVDDSSGILLSEKNASRRMYPASLTKMMTCLLVLEHGTMDDTVGIDNDVYVTRDTRVHPGDSYTVGNLLCEMMLQSDNVAALALAKYIAGDTLAFCNMMNRKAAYLGMDSTHFANPNGMPSDSTYSTARDLLVLARYCMADSAFAAIAGTLSMDIPLTDGRHLPCRNTNQLLADYDGCIGVKTGYTRQAGDCLASAAHHNGHTIFLILLNSKTHASRFSESAALLDYGFNMLDCYRKAI